jgi:hypothetical protein
MIALMELQQYHINFYLQILDFNLLMKTEYFFL